jgi:hypothetical protein
MTELAAQAGAGDTPPAEDITGQDQADPQGQGDTPDAEPQVDWEAEAKKWQTLSRKHEGRAKENASAAAELKKIQDADKTELQLATERADEAERRATESAANHARVMAAATYDLPVDAIDLLGSGTDDEINNRAMSIATMINNRATEIAKRTVEAMGLAWGGTPGSAPTAQGAAGLAGRPVESMFAGGAPSPGAQPRTMEEVFRGMIHQDIE